MRKDLWLGIKFNFVHIFFSYFFHFYFLTPVAGKENGQYLTIKDAKLERRSTPVRPPLVHRSLRIWCSIQNMSGSLRKEQRSCRDWKIQREWLNITYWSYSPGYPMLGIPVNTLSTETACLDWLITSLLHVNRFLAVAGFLQGKTKLSIDSSH